MIDVLSAPVLVLNANFEPLNVCNVRRGIGLIMQEKAALISNGRGSIQSVNQSFPIPSIIRLNHMVKRPRPKVKLCRSEIFRRDNYICQYCKKFTPSPTLDHVIPKRLNGPTSWENLVTACPSCNHKKGGRPLDQIPQMQLQQKPKAPKASASNIFGRYINQNSDWDSYINGW